MLKLEGESWMRTGYLHSLKFPSHKIMINYEEKESPYYQTLLTLFSDPVT